MSQAVIDAAMNALRGVLDKATAESTRDDGSIDMDALVSRLNMATEAAQALQAQLTEALKP